MEIMIKSSEMEVNQPKQSIKVRTFVLFHVWVTYVLLHIITLNVSVSSLNSVNILCESMT